MQNESTARAPRRWNTSVDGIVWLPRMADKVRMHLDGGLGAYLLGHSPVDRALLKRLGMTTAQFVTIARAAPTDEALLAALRARGMDEARIRRWSERFPTTYKSLIRMWDLDEGHRQPKPFERVALALFRPIEGPVMALYRRLKPAP